ncbi:C alpha-dehydrogenase LigD [Cupriavidus necator N-1]|jgi:NAD(P)-dependent dehydrogenase (short-subunit alcohol dehydrogenase family)|uniref:C alpha-dehydrogenase LigD n=1 Tax=Cupriavidus necator (strain ATCC 43291 / DSM 13513 / CCUG 52238 / LMG 8453 / N-1) TaxID=1042878 RepID=G0EUA3_CUPNN|nr:MULTISPECIES: SDR family oxidoreductase [Cupriavidus]AEI76910.1 C alpha-dehydrogenase LigD [Cupriavidus necator N-1]KAI3600781.1 Short-chain dehydrogenase/reductase SDR [Cupriavidus necator H850]MDX6014527.1 SDR family oxidoreductase [Cupriavidus necator]QUN29836.1 SDR family oxidoreductase [Cupriavidus sp. KK10]
MKDFSNKVAVITGGASGFGKEFAHIAADIGMKLVLADVQEDALDATVAEFKARNVPVIGLRTDVSRADQVQALADAAIEAFGQVNLLFNNAGVGAGGLIWENSEKDWEWVLGVNLYGVVHGVRIFTPLMLAAAGKDPAYQGHIVNTASMAGLLNPPAMGVYNVSKHAVVALTETLYQDLGLVTEQVRCSVLCPYFVPTGINQSQRNRPADLANQAPPTRSQLVSQALSDKAVGSGKVTAAEVAQLTFDAIRDESFYIYSHPQALAPVRQRFEDIVGQRNPGDPFADKPEVRAGLVAALRG